MTMKIQRSHIIGVVGLVGFALALYWAKAEAQTAREQVVSLQKNVDKERRAVRTLEAELAWMERPDRLDATARGKMGLTPVTAQNTVSLADLDKVAPLLLLPPAPSSAPSSPTPSAPAVAPAQQEPVR
jgi:hypothetical protein